jgi:hypothetical protein
MLYTYPALLREGGVVMKTSCIRASTFVDIDQPRFDVGAD